MCERVHAASGRCVVRLDGSTKPMLLKPSNLQPSAEAPPPSVAPPPAAPAPAPPAVDAEEDDDDDGALAMYGF